jgi:adenosylcobinamide-phosphate synthase
MIGRDEFFRRLVRPVARASQAAAARQCRHDALTGWMQWTARNFDAGRESHAWVVWCVAALAPAVLTFGVFFALDQVHSLLGLAFDVAGALPDARLSPVQPLLHRHPQGLDHGDEVEARRLLSEWRHLDASELPASSCCAT